MVIALTGVKRSGKDTAAEYFQKRAQVQGYMYERLRISNPLKRAVEAIYGWDPQVWDGPEKEQTDPFWGISPRQAAQAMGTDWSYLLSERYPVYERCTGQKTYIKSLIRNLEKPVGDFGTSENNIIYIISDIRFQYELDALREYGVHSIRIRRPEAEETIDNHPSEREILNLFVDTEVMNDGTISELYGTLSMCADSFGMTPLTDILE